MINSFYSAIFLLFTIKLQPSSSFQCLTISHNIHSQFQLGGINVGNSAKLHQHTKLNLSVSDLGDSLEQIQASVLTQAYYLNSQLLNDVQEKFAEPLSQISTGLLDLYQNFYQLSSQTQIAISLAGVLALTSVTLYNLSFPPKDYREGYEPYLRGAYNPDVARSYYSKYPMLVLRRFLEILRISNGFVIKLLIDNYVTKKEEENRGVRATELLELIQKTGPTAIKIGQALSVRPDLIPYEYANTLSTLQDRVTPFDSKLAKGLLEDELLSRTPNTNGAASLSDIFEETKPFEVSPVASASIGQVYRATLKNSKQDVAVKIQRPNVLAEIALDLYIVREYLAPLYKKFTKSGTDYVSLANEWGRGFIAELDYGQEMENTKKFQYEMKIRNLDKVVTAPTIVDDFCTNRILVTEWIDGVRVDETPEIDDVTRLCSVALNAYLIMLLEIGTLHCDPHPGNLFRDKEGKLIILDFGMTLDTSPTLQYDLLEFIAHLTSRDYDRVPEDLVSLDFLKAERAEDIQRQGFLEPLKFLLQQATEGGGGTKVRERVLDNFREQYPGLSDDEIRVKLRDSMQERMKEISKEESAISGITIEVEELQRRNQDAFKIPEWFLYTSRAFLTLEGICLKADEDYSLIKSCFPYVAKRLLNDDSERTQTALKDLLYGAGDFVSGDRLVDLTDGFSTYVKTTQASTDSTRDGTLVSSATSNVDLQRRAKTEKERNKSVAETAAAISLVKDTADVLLASDGNLIQNILINETAAMVTASAKDVLRDILIDRPTELRKQLPFSDLLPPPTFRDRFVQPFLQKTEEESKAQELIQKLSNQLSPPSPSTNSQNEQQAIFMENLNESLQDLDAEQVALVLKELRENLPKYTPLLNKLGEKFASTLVKKSRDDFERTLATVQESST